MMPASPNIKQFFAASSRAQKLIISIKTFIEKKHLDPIYM
jgi:hypothetical protein